MINSFIAKRPRFNIFSKDIFESYFYEIENMKIFSNILREIKADLEKEERFL